MPDGPPPGGDECLCECDAGHREDQRPAGDEPIGQSSEACHTSGIGGSAEEKATRPYTKFATAAPTPIASPSATGHGATPTCCTHRPR